MSTEGSDAADAARIRLTIPATVPYGRVTRLAVTSFASRNGYSYDDVEDLRIAVGELWALLVHPSDAEDRLRFTCSLHADGIEVDGAKVPARALVDIDPLSRQILAAVTDETTVDETVGRGRFRKHHHPEP